MSLLSTISAASYRGFQAFVGYTQLQAISFDYINIGAFSSDGKYLVVRREAVQSVADIYYFDGSTYSIQDTISLGGGFIQSMSLSGTGDYLAVGNYTSTTSGSGYVNVYVRSGTTWTLQQTIYPNDAPQTTFGYSVSITSDASRLAIGSPYTDTTQTDGGAFYVFTRSGTTWTQETKKTQSDVENSDRLGFSIDINEAGDLIVVGAPNGTTTVNGKVYTFTRSGTTWTQQQRILRPTGAVSRLWGREVSLASNGLYFAGTTLGIAGGNAGIGVFFYNGTSWVQQAYLLNNDAMNQNGGVAINNDGSSLFTAGPLNNKAVGYVYIRGNTNWGLDQIVSTSPPPPATSIAVAQLIGCNGSGNTFALIGYRGPEPNDLYILSRT